MSGLLAWIIFLALSLIALMAAAGMLLTMSMYRAGLALMTSFVALAGLFILLGADLLAAIQIMMNVGGMLVMVLFMVMMMMDPGGEMMWGMKREMHMPGPGAFSMHMPRGKPAEEAPVQHHEDHPTDWTCSMHPEVSQPSPGKCPKCGMSLIPRAEMTAEQDASEAGAQGSMYTCPMHPEVRQNEPGTCPKCGMTLVQQEAATEAQSADEHHHMPMEHHDMSMQMREGGRERAGQPMQEHEMHPSDHSMHMGGMTPQQYSQMMVDMAMSTTQLPWAMVLGALSALLLIVLVILTPWPLASSAPTQDATTAVGELLLSRYMIAFEGAAFLILTGIAGAVIFAHRDHVGRQQGAKQHEAGETEGQTYTCPMHPEVQQQPGTCPICGMTLIATGEAAAMDREHEEREEHERHQKHGGQR